MTIDYWLALTTLYLQCDDGYTLEGKAWNWCDRGVVDVIPKCVGAEGSDTTEEEITSPDSSTDNTDYNTEDEVVEEEKESGGSGVYGGCPLKEVENGEWTDPYGSSTYWILECKTGYS